MAQHICVLVLTQSREVIGSKYVLWEELYNLMPLCMFLHSDGTLVIMGHKLGRAF